MKGHHSPEGLVSGGPGEKEIEMNPATILIVGIIGGFGAAATYSAFSYARKAGPELTIGDLRPALPWEGLPVPIFFYTKPELLPLARR